MQRKNSRPDSGRRQSDGVAEHFAAARWLEYLDNPGADDAMGSHMGGCEKCRGLLNSLIAVRTQLASDATCIRAAAAGPGEIEAILERCLSGIRTGSRKIWTAAEAMLLLSVLVEPICGRGAARRTISLARHRSTPPSETVLSGRNWPLFISNLSETMTSICGAAAGQLVRQAGFSMTLQEG